MSEHLVPKVGEHRLYDLFSEKTSLETKASTARWYAEMMIDLFFSEKGKEELGEDKFNSLPLGDKIKIIKPYVSIELINSLNHIKQFGDIASHYKPGRTIKEEEVNNIVEKSLLLFDFALIDLLKDGGLRATEVTGTLFSTFLPSVRVRVLRKIINLNDINYRSDDDMYHLDKSVLALTKNGEISKALRILEKLRKNNQIDENCVSFWKEKLSLIQEKIDEDILPIPKNISDCKRNFDDVISLMSSEEKKANEKLINVFNIMLDQIEPSEMGDKKPNLLILM